MKTCNTCFVTSEFPGADIDETGQCHWCRESNSVKRQKKSPKINQEALQITADRIKAQRVGAYDCVIGVSGGLDSTYVAYIAKKLMGLNPLLIHYDHGFFYDLPRENMVNMANALGCELHIIKSKKGWDKKYIQAILSAFAKSKMYWGICTFCHYILPAAVARIAMDERIPFIMVSTNEHELALHVPKMAKIKAMVKAVFGGGLLGFPKMFYHLIRAQYFLLRLKLEFYMPPVSNLFSRGPRTSLETVNVTEFVPWETEKIKPILMDEVAWRLPEHPNLGMRFDCMIEEGFINHTFKHATGATIHGIIANNLIYDGLAEKSELIPVVEHYDDIIEDRTKHVRTEVFSKNEK